MVRISMSVSGVCAMPPPIFEDSRLMLLASKSDLNQSQHEMNTNRQINDLLESAI